MASGAGSGTTSAPASGSGAERTSERSQPRSSSKSGRSVGSWRSSDSTTGRSGPHSSAKAGRLAAHHLDQLGRVLTRGRGVALDGAVEQRAERPQVGGGTDRRRELPVLVDRARLLGGPALVTAPTTAIRAWRARSAASGWRGRGRRPVRRRPRRPLPGAGGGPRDRERRGAGRLLRGGARYARYAGPPGVGAQGVPRETSGGDGPPGAGAVVPGPGEVDAPAPAAEPSSSSLVVPVVVGILGRAAPGGGRPGGGGKYPERRGRAAGTGGAGLGVPVAGVGPGGASSPSRHRLRRLR